PNRRRQIDALELSTGKRPRLPVQSQIFETDSQQIAKASANLLENETRDLVHGAGRPQLAKEAMGCADAHGVDLGDVLTLDPIMERVGFDSTALAFGSGITRSRSMSITRPKPRQVSHAPKGLLNEKRLDVGSR